VIVAAGILANTAWDLVGPAGVVLPRAEHSREVLTALRDRLADVNRFPPTELLAVQFDER
jgi:hypothetical protein